ncbi:GNAT family N-acetyltransferase [Marinospirillum alkaliphilum]|uniref:tRNA(Met) cytidine acetyltransferase TmcA n=1 Tax=Marinospirillum alkaliphilum DSM 21637 TaxID=1122209 RepID=A0A1K1ZK00_9GAMM|nr:GNAT family N-acetyltransferase [Marinospirillum alkaliphilum]SFX74473.1 tRNA(Met) cytidine acetyltransferase [Marinospirillum alkaliphilum DSM 21637]
MPSETTLINWLQDLEKRRFRQLLWLRGDAGWCRAAALQWLARMQQLQDDSLKGCWVQAVTPAGELPDLPTGVELLPASRARHRLGSEQQVLVFDAFTGLHPDALGALSGTLQAGGLLLLLTPEPWSSQPDPDYRRLAHWPYEPEQLSCHFLQRCEHLLLAADVPRWSQSQGQQGNWWQLPAVAAASASGHWPLGAASEDQARLVQQLLEWVGQKPVVPVVVTANRGRGKSGALGLLLRALALHEPQKKLLITAPSREASDAVFARLQDLPPERTAQIGFVAPDALLQTLPTADLLLVDEAAALPVPVLQQLLQHYPRSVFATTQQGYEGNGRGFALRFTRHLDQQAPGWLSLTLRQPLRWAALDPLERLTDRLLLLDAEVVDPAPDSITSIQIQWLDRQQLLADESLLSQVFGLLVLAHYRTTPDDFRQLLDAPDLQLACAWQDQHPVGLVLVQQEGGFDAELAAAIFMGQRRPQGHLLAQSLTFHGGFVQAAQLHWWRVQRILVHPLLQGRGIGLALLDFVQQQAQQNQGIDLLGSSFGVTESLLAFWSKAGYASARVGITRDQASGEHTLQVVKGLTEAGQALQQALQQRLAETLPELLPLALQQLPATVVAPLLAGLPLACEPLNAQDQQELQAYAVGHRPLALTRTALKRWLMLQLQQGLTAPSLYPWIQLLLQQQHETLLEQQLGCSGKKELDRCLRGQLKALLQ